MSRRSEKKNHDMVQVAVMILSFRQAKEHDK